MKPKEFVQQLDDNAVLAAIARAEKNSSGEVRLYVAHNTIGDVLAGARKQFAALGMDKTRRRNGVLLFFAPKVNQFAIVGDEGINLLCGQEFWTRIVENMAPKLKTGDYTRAVVDAINEVGEVLARHFPRDPNDTDELPDAIVGDD